MLRVKRLDDGLAGGRAAPRASGDLGQQLERPLASPEIGQSEPDVGRNDPHQRHTGKIVSLRDHLVPIRTSMSRRANRSSVLTIAPRLRTVSRSRRARRACGRSAAISASTRSVPKPSCSMIRTRAHAARLWQRHRVVAVVTPRTPGGPVHREAHAAVRTLQRFATLPAEDRHGITSPVEQHHGLVTARKAIGQSLAQPPAENHVGPFFGIFLAHVDDASHPRAAGRVSGARASGAHTGLSPRCETSRARASQSRAPPGHPRVSRA